MSSRSKSRSISLDARRETRQLTVCVVDPRHDHYEGWDALAKTHGVALYHLHSPDEALKLARSQKIDLWVVSAELPGLSGCELCGMLKEQSPSAVVYLVANEYSTEVERRAWAVRASLFGCKPGHVDWLRQWIARQPNLRRTPIREPALIV